MSNHLEAPMSSNRSGMIYSSRDGWVPKAPNRSDSKASDDAPASGSREDDGRIIRSRNPRANPATWTEYSTGVNTPDISIAGLGGYRTDRKGRTMATSAAVHHRDDPYGKAGRPSTLEGDGTVTESKATSQRRPAKSL